MKSEMPSYLISEQSCHHGMHALVTGSFDPVTVGHMDVIERAAQMFDKVTVAVFVNPEKEYLLSLAEKETLLRAACRKLPNISVTASAGMVSDFCRENAVDVIVRGFRNGEDTAFEHRSAEYNYAHCGIKTLLLAADDRYRQISSSFLKERLLRGESVGELLPDGVEEPFFNMLLQQL